MALDIDNVRKQETGSRSPRSIHEYALNLLAGRAYTARGLSNKLTVKGFAPADVAAEMDSLERAGLVDDERFAREYARQKLNGGKSARRVELELIHKGIGRESAHAAIATVITEETIDFEKSLRVAAQKKLPMLHGVERSVARKRLFAYLARRGFEIDAVRRIVGDLID